MRPIVTREQYQALLAKAGDVDLALPTRASLGTRDGTPNRSHPEAEVVRCRSKSRRVRWRGDTDKQGRDHVTPLSLVAAGALRTARRARPGLGDSAPAQGPVRCWWLEGRADDPEVLSAA